KSFLCTIEFSFSICHSRALPKGRKKFGSSPTPVQVKRLGPSEASMSILFVLLTFLVIMTISYFVRHGQVTAQVAEGALDAQPAVPLMTKENGFEIPKGFCFHPGHTWVFDEGRQNARVGLDSFATHLMGKIERVEVANLNRWVRQGQKVRSEER